MKNKDPFSNQKLDAEEQDLLDSIERDEWAPVENMKAEKAFAQAAAINYLRKNKNINI